jgi:hypothetical protein
LKPPLRARSAWLGLGFEGGGLAFGKGVEAAVAGQERLVVETPGQIRKGLSMNFVGHRDNAGKEKAPPNDIGGVKVIHSNGRRGQVGTEPCGKSRVFNRAAEWQELVQPSPE